MPRRVLAALVALVCIVAGAARPAAAGLSTTIDIDYDYRQENIAGDVLATAAFNQKYEVTYETSLTSIYDFVGAVTLDLKDVWSSRAATTSSVAPSIKMQVTGEQSSLTMVYEGVVAATDAYLEAGETSIYSNSFSTTLTLTPRTLPEFTLNYQRQRTYEAWASDSTQETMALTARKDIRALRLEFNLNQLQVSKVLPLIAETETTTWSGKATFKKVLWGGTDFELAYEIKETYTENDSRGVFVSLAEDYVQTARSRLKNSLALGQRMTLGLTWEYQYEQDLFKLAYDHKLKNKYQLDLRWDLMNWFKLSAEARRETESTVQTVGEDDTRDMTDTIKAGFDMAMVEWFRLAGKAEFKESHRLKTLTGGSVDNVQDEKYELVARHRIANFWNLTVSGSAASKRENGWLTDRETKFKAELQLKFFDFTVTPSYEASRSNDWTWGFHEPIKQQRLQEARLDFTYTLKLLDLFLSTFNHQYGLKTDDSLDKHLNFTELIQYNENTRINVVIAEFLRSLRLEGEIERRASDTANGPSPAVVEVSYRLKLDWQLRDLSLGSTLVYNDKAYEFDDMTFNTKIGWKSEYVDMAGEYEYAKIFADETSEKRRLNLRLNYRF